MPKLTQCHLLKIELSISFHFQILHYEAANARSLWWDHGISQGWYAKVLTGAKLLTFLLTWRVFWRIARWLPLGVEARMRADLQKSKMDFATQSSEGKKWISTAHFPQYILRIHCKFGEPQGLGLHWTDMYRCQFFGLVTRWMSLSSGWNSPPRGWNPILSRGRSPCSPENGKNNQLLLRKFSRRCFLTIALNRVKGAEFFIRRESETFWPNVWSCSELHVAGRWSKCGGFPLLKGFSSFQAVP